jgi:hypothetical protein
MTYANRTNWVNTKVSVSRDVYSANRARVMYVVNFLWMSGRQVGAVIAEAERVHWETRTCVTWASYIDNGFSQNVLPK